MDAVRALDDASSVSFDISSETFTIHVADGGDIEAILSTIRSQGFTPTLLDATPTSARPVDRIRMPRSPRLKEALGRARARGVPLVLTFGGAFCPACRNFEEEVLSDARVAEALRSYEFHKVDIQSHKQAAQDFGVTAVPDLWVVGVDLAVLARENRTMDTAELLRVLEGCSPR